FIDVSKTQKETEETKRFPAAVPHQCDPWSCLHWLRHRRAVSVEDPGCCRTIRLSHSATPESAAAARRHVIGRPPSAGRRPCRPPTARRCCRLRRPAGSPDHSSSRSEERRVG